jgi:tyramine---L-glutamate ligase
MSRRRLSLAAHGHTPASGEQRVNVFVFEWVTGGGWAAAPSRPPAALAREGDMMLRALLADLGRVPSVRLTTSRDPRLPALSEVRAIVPAPGEDAFALYARAARAADAVWPIAPETDGLLERLARETLGLRKILLGCRPDAVHLAASKRATALALQEAGVPVVPTFGERDRLAPCPGRWVVKPDDGVGCEGAVLVSDWRAAAARLAGRSGNLVAQPWIDGRAASLSLLCRDGNARLLSANLQHVGIVDGRPRLQGITVNAVADREGTLSGLARRIAAVLPGLWGYVGVDLVLLDQGGALVLEINPRLTTAYCGLRRALGINPAALVLDWLRPEDGGDWATPPVGTAELVSLEAERGD